MLKVYKTEIKPKKEQIVKIHKTIGVCRYVYNLYLSENKKAYQANSSFISGYEFSKWLNNDYTKEKDQWIKEVSSKAVKQSIMNGDKAFKNFFKRGAKFPRYKKKKNQDVKCYFPKNNKTDWTTERHRIKIPTLGWIRLKEFGYIPLDAKIVSGTVSMKAGRYYVSVLVKNAETAKSIDNFSEGIGIDLGLKEFVVCSNDKVYKNINKTTKVSRLEKKLKREQRSLSRKYENLKKRGEKSVTKKRANVNKNILRVQKLYAR
ncbi:transposase, partial [Bacillaceae bacterium Marseille-Q3522]|nr:transposase [Bacillaceae bacterium Marseille-Q3522]